MYILKSEKGQEAFYVIEQNKEFTIGRKGCDFLIENDTSISKRHATIIMKDDVLEIQDIGSKFLTYINSLKIEKNQPVILKEDDVVRFGMLNSYFRIIKKKLVVLCSGLTSSNKTQLKQILESLNGKLVQQWDPDLSYLTVNKIVLTSKVIQAIIEGLPIVSLKFFEDLQSCINNHLIPPDEKKYLPKNSNLMLKNLSFDYNPDRKILFKDKIFVFKNPSSLDDIINCCGGKSITYNQENITKETLSGYNPQYILISDDIFNPKSNHPFDKLISLLNEINKRPIPQQEIPLAIMKCSMETNCNPDFDRVKNVCKGNEMSAPTKPLLVPETEQKYTDIYIGTTKVVPETFQSQLINDTGIDDVIKTEEIRDNQICQSTDVDSNVGVKRSADIGLNDNTKKRKIDVNIFTSTQIEHDNTTIGESNSSHSNPSSESLSQIFKRKSADVVDNIDETIKTKKQKILNPFGTKKTSSLFQKNVSSSSKDEENRSVSIICKPSTNLVEAFKTPAPPPLTVNRSFSSKGSSIRNPFATPVMKQKKEAPSTNKDVEVVEIKLNNDKKNDKNSALEQHQKEYLWKTIKESDRDVKIVKNTKDSTLSDLMESFRDCVVIKKAPLVVQRDANMSMVSFDESGKPNYKRFKKVLPIHKQTSVIKNFKKFVCSGDF